MSAPQVPPRPTRALYPHQSPMGFTEIPRIPPRPGHRISNRSRSSSRDNFPRSPLNEIPNSGSKSGSMYSNESQNTSDSNFEAPLRPPSVSLPSIGQEGSEYADIEYGKPQDATTDSDSNHTEPTQSRNIGSDLPLHAPKPSLSSSTAKARVSNVTRTDSSQAAAAGFGKSGTPLTNESLQNPALRSKVSFSRTESVASTERPASAQASDSDHGIPEIGQRVPMYPDAGDVQAPSPSPFLPTAPPGIGFHNDGIQKPGRHHGRTRSGREVFRGPPGSYGMHGHGVMSSDQFEKAWYDKHPDALVREEHGQYGPGISGNRGEWALSSEDLNKIVRDTASRGPGTSPNLVATPNEQIGYMATEEYTSRINTPANYFGKAHSNHSQTHADSPLRKASIVPAVDDDDTSELKEPPALAHLHSDYASENETEDDEIYRNDEIHIDDPAVRQSSISGNDYDPPTEEIGIQGVNIDAEGGRIEETGYGVPILAADEVAKEPESEYLHPAVSPVQERRSASYFSGQESEHQIGYRNNSGSNSRPSSRPVSIHGGSLPNLSRFASHDEREDIHTPLENVEEYEPLFPDQQDKDGHHTSTVDKYMRREIMKRRFPSQDIWEDTPNSLQLQATVETPEPSEEQAAKIPNTTSASFESPETEAARKVEIREDEKAKLNLKNEHLANPLVKRLRKESDRPELKQRFPSRDIWEDSPDSACLETTIGGPPDDEVKSPSGEVQDTDVVGATGKPSIPPKPAKSKLSGDSHGSGDQAFPSIPARPSRKLNQVPAKEVPPPADKILAESSPDESKQNSSLESRKAPTLPDRPKPQVPARPSRSVAHENPEMAPLSKSTSANSIGSSDAGDDKRGIVSSKPTPRPKPALPSRPLAASLKAGFLSDLDKRLQLGPQAPKPQEKALEEREVTKEKAPLADARKGRVRGPARRKPGASVPIATSSIAEVVEEEGPAIKSKWSIQKPWTVWQTADDGSLNVAHAISIASLNAQTEKDHSPESQVAGVSIDGTKTSELIAPDNTISIAEDPSSAVSPAMATKAETDQGDITSSSKEIESQDSSIQDYTPSSTSSPAGTDHHLSHATGQAGEKAITLNPDIEGEEKKAASVRGETQ